MTQKIYWKPLSWIFLVGIFFVGLNCYDDYGMSWDEPLEKENGLVSAQYLNERFHFTDQQLHETHLANYRERDHGAIFNLMVFAVERLTGQSSYRAYYLLRHFLVFLTFFIGLILFYQLLIIRWPDSPIPLLGLLFLVTSPRIFAHAFYNGKDIPMLVAYLWAVLTMVQFFRQPNWKRLVLHGIACGVLMSVRIIGLMVPLITLGFMSIALLGDREWKSSLGKWGLRGGVFILTSFIFTVVFYPYLWGKPLLRFFEVIDRMAHYPWEGVVLFNGQFISGNAVPWTYAPVWMGVTTPFLYLLLIGVGSVLIIRKAIQKLIKLQFVPEWPIQMDWLLFAVGIGPLLAVVLRDPVLYDGWRHLQFIYPPLIYIALAGPGRLWMYWKDQPGARQWIVRIILAVIALRSLSIGLWQYQNHPYQQVYFNGLTGQDQFGKFDLDYWGLSYRQALEAILDLDDEPQIRVANYMFPGQLNWEFLPEKDRSRIQLVEKPEDADYYITNYRFDQWWMEQYTSKAFPFNQPEVWSASAGKTKIISVYRIEDN